MPYFKENDIENLKTNYSNIKPTYHTTLLKWMEFNNKLTNDEAKEYLLHGFLRRLQILKICIKNIYNIYPPDRERSDLLNEQEIDNIIINWQSFIINLFGCIDNLAWILVKEKILTLEKMQVDFYHKKFKKHLSANLKDYLSEREEWFKALTNFRDALAHRISPYMPRGIDPESGGFVNHFIITHSIGEKSPMLKFHPQLIVDWLTIIEFSDKFLEELQTNL